MIKVNKNYNKLPGNYLFSEISKKISEYQKQNPDKKIIRLGIGDVTKPLTPKVIEALQSAIQEMSAKETFKGYGPEQGYSFLREMIAENDFTSRNINISADEIFVSTGAKEDTANFQELFDNDIKIAIPDPVYPVYVDSNVMAGRSGEYVNGRYTNFVYLECNKENDFRPDLPKEPVDLIYLCFPNNPTGQTATKEELEKWVLYAKKNKALILFDAAYEAFIKDSSIPKSIYEIEGAKEVAVEFRSLSKTAGFTGTRLSYTIIPKELMIWDDAGNQYELNKLWNRRQTTKFNGTAYLIQKGAGAIFTKEGKKEITSIIDYYLENAKIIKDGLSTLGIESTGGINSPYIWLKTPGNLTSWEFFHKLLNEIQVVGTPGSGFGKCGEGYFRLSAFGERENVIEAVKRISNLK
ncbi:MAG: LL-diaminopimelate aminotransferase [Spirochaetes bacterium GWF1_31_7]|nr:MAG: LL-diaminopimelate aminotransferase [Spirochaetes bacterium GWE1_32_154]OHD46147.1 MAG: LL-diaminopimelate aminotransferase [Spirochaetes bacterium GWE2_31_10]OHD49888.1 MAG: LL-diaminopimelate aminotransferase [Spirochaetes bacterium GWF1_31_7]OHD78900.1 MAG: LL-diaminopimelate aminotransferase [Spirochaetes bacterium RIFOXYB1_FULL_32_8]HBD96283.1 LL-diaminopimelate aminotransferase [Spirochaetia bacterium]